MEVPGQLLRPQTLNTLYLQLSLLRVRYLPFKELDSFAARHG